MTVTVTVTAAAPAAAAGPGAAATNPTIRTSRCLTPLLVTFLIILISIKVKLFKDDCLYCNNYCLILLCVVNNNHKYCHILLTIHAILTKQYTTICHNIQQYSTRYHNIQNMLSLLLKLYDNYRNIITM